MLAAALLHDVLEDTDTTTHEMQDFLLTIMDRNAALDTIKMVDELTDIYTKENYPDWNRRKRKDKEAERLSKVSANAQTVKYADIIDNSKDILNAGKQFAKKFFFECRTLLRVMDKGNEQLRGLAITEIDQRIQAL
jgi:(p)ppGpp synthase/HD superfamily hydrolase